jgi:hypothetical protein
MTDTKEPDWGFTANEIGHELPLRLDADIVEIETYLSTELAAAYALGKSHGPDWLPIADAPRDGTPMLVATKDGARFWRVQYAKFVAQYSEESTEDFAEYCQDKDEYFTPEGWYEMCFEHDEYSSMAMNVEPTYFQYVNPPEPKP